MSLLLSLAGAPPAETVSVDKYWVEAIVPQKPVTWHAAYFKHSYMSVDPIAPSTYTPTIDKFWTDSPIPQKPKEWHSTYFKHSYRADYVPAPPAVVNISWIVQQELPQHRTVETRDLSVFVPDLAANYTDAFIQHGLIANPGEYMWRDMSAEPIVVTVISPPTLSMSPTNWMRRRHRR